MSALVTIPKHYVSDWSQGHGTHWAEISPYDPADTYWYKPYPPVGTFVNSEWVARYSRASLYGKIQTMPRFVLSAKDGFDVEVPITLNAGPKSANGGYYFSVALYNGEASYFGLYFAINDQQQGLVYVHNCGYAGFETSVQGVYLFVTDWGWWSKGDKVYAKIVCDAAAGETRLYARNETKNPGGGYQLMWTRYHEIMVATDPRLGLGGPGWVSQGNGGISGGTGQADFRWLDPCSLWISGSSFADGNLVTPWNIDLHPITINQYGEEILGGAGSFYPWSRYWNPQATGFNLWPVEFNSYVLKESKEAAREPEGLVAYSLDEYDWGQAYLTGTTIDVVSPTIAKGNGSFSTLRLYGKETTYGGTSEYPSGTCKIEILDAATQQPLTINGVSEWHPDSGPFTSIDVDLSGILSPEIQLKFTMLSNGEVAISFNGGWMYNAITPILYGFVVTGTPPPAEASPHGGRFQIGQTVTINSLDGMTVIYTLDGSDPRSYILMNPEGRAIFNPDGDVITTGG